MKILRLVIATAILGGLNATVHADTDIDELELYRQEMYATLTGVDAEIQALKERVRQLEDLNAASGTDGAARSAEQCQPARKPVHNHSVKNADPLVADSSW